MFDYTSAQFAVQYRSIKQWVTAPFSCVHNPKAYILGGQPGACVNFESNTSKNEVSAIRIPPTQIAKAEQVLNSNSAKNRIKK